MVSYIFSKKPHNYQETGLSYIFLNVFFLYFGKGIFRTLVYLETWHKGTFSYFRKGIFRTLA